MKKFRMTLDICVHDEQKLFAHANKIAAAGKFHVPMCVEDALSLVTALTIQKIREDDVEPLLSDAGIEWDFTYIEPNNQDEEERE